MNDSQNADDGIDCSMLKLLFDSSPQGVLVTHDGEIVYSNSTIGKAAGFKPEHAVGQNISQLADILSPEDRESAIARFIALSSGKKESDTQLATKQLESLIEKAKCQRVMRGMMEKVECEKKSSCEKEKVSKALTAAAAPLVGMNIETYETPTSRPMKPILNHDYVLATTRIGNSDAEVFKSCKACGRTYVAKSAEADCPNCHLIPAPKCSHKHWPRAL